MSEPVLWVDRDDGIATLTLNRPRVLNALSRELRAALVRTFREIEEDDAVGVVIVTGAGRAFTAGLDLKELGGETEASSDVREAVGTGAGVIDAIEACTRPVIGAVNGVAVTGGFELALACDLLIASTEARFADTHARVGIFPGWGLSQKLSRIVGPGRAKELSLTGNYCTADQALAWGLVNRVVAPHELLPTCKALARDMLSCDQTILRAYKRVIDEGFCTTMREGLALERRENRERSGALTAGEIRARRVAVQARGRTQAKDA
jgi:enoyl-CoA hydratase